MYIRPCTMHVCEGLGIVLFHFNPGLFYRLFDGTDISRHSVNVFGVPSAADEAIKKPCDITE